MYFFFSPWKTMMIKTINVSNNGTVKKGMADTLETHLVPNSANRNARRCFGWRCNLWQGKERSACWWCSRPLLEWGKCGCVCVCVCLSQFADVCEVDKGSFLSSYTDHLRRLHDKLPLLSGHHVRVLLSHDVEDSVQELKKRRHRELQPETQGSNKM